MDIFVWTCIFVGSHCVLGSRWPTGALSVGPTMSPYPHHCPLCHPTLTIVTLHSPIGPLLGDAHSLHHMGKPASKYTEHKLLKSCHPSKKLCLQLNVSVSKTIQWIRASLAVWVKGDLLAGGRDATHSHTCRSISSSSPSFFAPLIIFITLLPIPFFFCWCFKWTPSYPRKPPSRLETQHTHSSHAPPIIFITFILLLLPLEVNSNFNIYPYKLLSRVFINTSNKSSLAALPIAIISHETQLIKTQIRECQHETQLIKTHHRMPTRNTVDQRMPTTKM